MKRVSKKQCIIQTNSVSVLGESQPNPVDKKRLCGIMVQKEKNSCV